MKYFAYGSNMLTQWLTDQARAPSAVACGIARAPGFVVRFHKASKDKSGKCALIATADEAAAADGVLYEVSDVDGDSLDRAERGYSRRSVQLVLADGRTLNATTYMADENYVNEALVPFDWYRDLVVAGATEHQLPAHYIEELARVPAVSDSNSARAASRRRILDGSGAHN